ncbi:MAG: hypothetical protein AAFR81_25965 [Chloroflexota bacterium]
MLRVIRLPIPYIPADSYKLLWDAYHDGTLNDTINKCVVCLFYPCADEYA